jgi:membrane glycosyltransferase
MPMRWPGATAWSALWPQTLYGVAVNATMLALAPTLYLWALPLVFGYLVAVPFSVITAAPALGRAMARIGLCAIPEEFDPPPELVALAAA